MRTDPEPESTTTCSMLGLEPDNPLAFLAWLGLLKALGEPEAGWSPRLSWTGQPPVAMLHMARAATREEVAKEADEGVRRLAPLLVIAGPEEARCRTCGGENLDFTPEDFRALVGQARNDEGRQRVIASLGSDGALDEGKNGETRKKTKVAPTALCMMLGQGHQHFLSRLGRSVMHEGRNTVDDIMRALFETWEHNDEVESLRWDPAEDRRHAYQFGDPSEARNKIGTVAGAVRLACVGFSLLPVVPAGRRTPATVGMRTQRGSDRVLCWPLVGAPTSLEGHLALMSHPSLVAAESGNTKGWTDLAAYGVVGVARSSRILVDRFFTFERARVDTIAVA